MTTRKITIIEPCWFHTDGISRSLVRTPSHPAYDKPTLRVAAARKWPEGNPVVRGDATRRVEIIYRIAALPEPPLHFPMGKDCVQSVKGKITRLQTEIDEYESWSRGLDRDAVSTR